MTTNRLSITNYQEKLDQMIQAGSFKDLDYERHGSDFIGSVTTVDALPDAKITKQ